MFFVREKNQRKRKREKERERFKGSGLKVNETKTEITIFYKNNCNPADVLINGTTVRTKDTIKVLGITMDTTLTWQEQVNNTINNVQSKIHAK
jgi:hypothetical protein